MQFDLTVPTLKIFEISKIQDGGNRHLGKSKTAISQPRFERFRRNLA